MQTLVFILRANLDHVLGTSQKSKKNDPTLLGIFSVIESLYDELYLYHAIPSPTMLLFSRFGCSSSKGNANKT